MSVDDRPTDNPAGIDPAHPRLRVVGDDELASSSVARWPEVDRRSGDDRRYGPTRGWDSLRGFRRRRHGRRAGERDNIYVDRYTRSDIVLLLGVFVLNILDAFFTLRWLEMGGTEGNPLMDALIQTNDMMFLFQKCVVVGIWLLILIVHKNFRIARLGLWCVFVLYACLLFYHFFLHAMGPPPMPPPDAAHLVG